MESGERLESSSPAPSSLHMASSSTSSSPAPPQTLPSKYSPAPSPKSSSPLTACGNLLQMTADERVNISGPSNGFSLASHPAFGLYTSSSGRSEFGGLGSLGLSAMAARSQFATFPDWWRPSDAHTRGAAAFFTPLLGLHPAFVSSLKRNNPSDLHTSGVNGAVNGRSALSSTVMKISSSPAKMKKEKTQASVSRSQNSSHEPVQLHQKTNQRTKEKKTHRRPPEMSSMSGNQSGSLSDSSTDGDDSSSDDMEEEDEDNEDEDDDDDQSSDSEESDSEKESPVKEKRLTQNASESKKKRPRAADRNTAQDRHGDSVPLTSTYHVQTCSHPAGLPQSTSLFLPSPRSSEEENQQHISVIQAIGLAACNTHLAQSNKEACPPPLRSSPNPITFSNSSKQYPTLTSPKNFTSLSSPKQGSFSSSPKPLALCSPKKTVSSSLLKPLSLPSLPKPPTLLASKKASHKPTLLMTSSRLTQPTDTDGLKESKRNLQEETFKLKQPPHPRLFVKRTFPPKSQISGDTNLFLSPHPNEGSLGTVQDAPLALITKPRRQNSTPNSTLLSAASSPPYLMPMNLSIGSKDVLETSASSHKFSASSGLPRSRKTTKTVHSVKPLTKTNAACRPVDLTRSSESDLHSSKDSDDSLGDDNNDDDDEDDIEDEDSGSSLSELESNLESDSDDSEDDIKECAEMEADSDADRTLAKGAEVPSSTPKSSVSNLSANYSLLNLQITNAPSLPRGLLIPTTSNATLSKHTSAPAYTFTTTPGSGKRRRVTDERVLRLPLEFGWQRETRIRTVAGRLQGEVAYFAPCGKKLRQYPDVMKYLGRNGITEISRDNFSFSTKIKVGDFYEAREGPEGSRWFLLAEGEIVPTIIAMDGRRSRRSKYEVQTMMGDGSRVRQWKAHPLNVGERNFQDISDAKLLRKLEAQEIARQAAQIKIMRKLEKQAMAQAAKEARKQRALIAAEERRKKREQIKILKQQEKIKRIQQIRMEKELRAQQILEAKRKKKEAAANAKILEAEKRNKEKEIRRLQAVILKHQELERHRLDMERERRRQHMILMKAMEARKKAEEKERLKKEKKDEKRLNKERKLELRRLELEKAKELKKPNEDMCLADHKALPELCRIRGLVLPGNTFSDCLMVLQFLHCFGKVLGLGFENSNMLTMSDLQEGLLNIGNGMDLVQDLLVNMLSAALCDPGMPAGHKSKTILGDHLTNVEINRDNVSEILQLYMEGHSEQTEVATLAVSLRTKAFQAHSPSQKASILAFLVNELCCSKAVISEIDKNIDYMTNLRKDKWAVEGKLRKLRSIHAKKTGKKDSNMGAEDNQSFVTPTVRNKCKRKEGDSEEEEDEDDDSDEQGDDDDEEEEELGGRKMKKVDICEEEDDSVQSASIEELEKQIERVHKQQSQINQKMFDSSHSLRSAMIGQDRYKRRYWILPHCSSILVEGVESGDCSEEEEKERKRQKATEGIKVKEEQLEETMEPGVSSTVGSTNGDSTVPDSQKDRENLFLQKPGSLSKLSKLLEVARMAQDPAINSQNSRPAEVTTSAPHPLYPTSQAVAAQQGLMEKADALVASPLGDAPLKSSQWMNRSPQSILHYDQLSKVLTEKNNQWFSLLPRSPCDESSVTSGSSPPDSSSSPQPVRTDSPSVVPFNPAGGDCKTPVGINNMLSLIHQHVKSGTHSLHDMFTSIKTPTPPVSGPPESPMLDRGPQHAEGDRNKANGNTVNKSETPEPLNDLLTCASFPAAEVVTTHDFLSPQPVPEEMLRGWWMVSDMENLHSLVRSLHSRGIREKVLQKQIQKHLEDMGQLCATSKDGLDLTRLEKQQLHEEMLESWCVEDQAMEVDITLLQQVEALERKVVSAGLHVKGWKRPEPQSESEDLVYVEHKPFSSPPRQNRAQRDSGPDDLLPGPVVRQPNNPLDVAVTRLAELERNIERSSEEEVAPGMRLWRKALGQVRSSAQLSLCIQQLQKSIAWERAIMKVHCQLCQKGDNEDLLLLCDGCDKGCHTYCHKPKIITVPEGDWFCPTCAAKESGQSPWSRKQQSRTAGGGKKSSDVKRNGKPSVVRELINEEDASSMPKKGSKEFKKRRRDDSPPVSQAKCDIPVPFARRAKIHKDDKNDLATCRVLLAELENHQDAWPFLTPVDLKAVPGYRKVIKKPMDLSTIREKLSNNQYLNLETFIIDVNLVFDNCERFNEDNSEIGRAGHNMRRYFDTRWTELLQ